MEKTISQTNDSAVIGGTFDVFHLGHQEYIKYSFQNASKIYIFLSKDDYIKHAKNYQIEPYQQREQKIRNFIQANSFSNEFTIFPLNSLDQIREFCIQNDISKTITSEDYVFLFNDINEKRKKLGKFEMNVIVKPRFEKIIPNLCSTIYHTLETSDPRSLGFPVLSF